MQLTNKQAERETTTGTVGPVSTQRLTQRLKQLEAEKNKPKPNFLTSHSNHTSHENERLRQEKARYWYHYSQFLPHYAEYASHRMKELEKYEKTIDMMIEEQMRKREAAEYGIPYQPQHIDHRQWEEKQKAEMRYGEPSPVAASYSSHHFPPNSVPPSVHNSQVFSTQRSQHPSAASYHPSQASVYASQSRPTTAASYQSSQHPSVHPSSSVNYDSRPSTAVYEQSRRVDDPRLQQSNQPVPHPNQLASPPSTQLYRVPTTSTALTPHQAAHVQQMQEWKKFQNERQQPLQHRTPAYDPENDQQLQRHFRLQEETDEWRTEQLLKDQEYDEQRKRREMRDQLQAHDDKLEAEREILIRKQRSQQREFDEAEERRAELERRRRLELEYDNQKRREFGYDPVNLNRMEYKESLAESVNSELQQSGPYSSYQSSAPHSPVSHQTTPSRSLGSTHQPTNNQFLSPSAHSPSQRQDNSHFLSPATPISAIQHQPPSLSIYPSQSRYDQRPTTGASEWNDDSQIAGEREGEERILSINESQYGEQSQHRPQTGEIEPNPLSPSHDHYQRSSPRPVSRHSIRDEYLSSATSSPSHRNQSFHSEHQSSKQNYTPNSQSRSTHSEVEKRRREEELQQQQEEEQRKMAFERQQQLIREEEQRIHQRSLAEEQQRKEHQQQEERDRIDRERVEYERQQHERQEQERLRQLELRRQQQFEAEQQLRAAAEQERQQRAAEEADRKRQQQQEEEDYQRRIAEEQRRRDDQEQQERFRAEAEQRNAEQRQRDDEIHRREMQAAVDPVSRSNSVSANQSSTTSNTTAANDDKKGKKGFFSGLSSMFSFGKKKNKEEGVEGGNETSQSARTRQNSISSNQPSVNNATTTSGTSSKPATSRLPTIPMSPVSASSSSSSDADDDTSPNLPPRKVVSELNSGMLKKKVGGSTGLSGVLGGSRSKLQTVNVFDII